MALASGDQALEAPGSPGPGVAQAVLQVVGAGLKELDGGGDHAQPATVGGIGGGSVG